MVAVVPIRRTNNYCRCNRYGGCCSHTSYQQLLPVQQVWWLLFPYVVPTIIAGATGMVAVVPIRRTNNYCRCNRYGGCCSHTSYQQLLPVQQVWWLLFPYVVPTIIASAAGMVAVVPIRRTNNYCRCNRYGGCCSHTSYQQLLPVQQVWWLLLPYVVPTIIAGATGMVAVVPIRRTNNYCRCNSYGGCCSHTSYHAVAL